MDRRRRGVKQGIETMSVRSRQLDSFSGRVRRLWDLMNPCVLCPRRCGVFRSRGERGFCGIGEMPVVSSAGPHFGEESVLVGGGGSGTIFFAGCNLGCLFCQNYDISHYREGREVSIGQLAESMLALQRYGCVNINLVSPTHVAAAAAAAVEMARKEGLKLPIVYNTGGYDSVETLKLLEGVVDIYMPDMKYSDPAVAAELSDAPDYPEVNRRAVVEMQGQCGELEVEGGVVRRGLLVRHLVLPNNMAGSFEIIDFLAREVSARTAINVMDQYRPCFKADSKEKINRRPTALEIRGVLEYAQSKGLRIIC